MMMVLDSYAKLALTNVEAAPILQHALIVIQVTIDMLMVLLVLAMLDTSMTVLTLHVSHVITPV